jgi:hypothetical protein
MERKILERSSGPEAYSLQQKKFGNRKNDCEHPEAIFDFSAKLERFVRAAVSARRG